MLAYVIKIITLAGNAFLTLLSIVMFIVAVFAWFEPPDAQISPNPISEHRQYSVAVIFLLLTSVCILGLAALGISSILLSSSFFLSLYILILLVQISSQVVLSAFAIANSDKIHATILSEWKKKLKDATFECTISNVFEECQSPLSAQIRVERIIFILLSIFLAYQVIMLCLSCYYCEVLTKKERNEAIEKDNTNED
ncbi:hypothetical protein Tcan_15022 [Toxocara canis]|uniref:Uncharacterized protein n=1 Tax=Toxocara canis TaxID=6265 RepID=A0A0B2USG6_TOXCA|nr:hypothetical protein Tcan_15022 [Toxocara canis]